MRKLGAFLSRTSLVAASVMVFTLFAILGFPRLAATFESQTPLGGEFDTVYFYTPSEALVKASLYSHDQVAASIYAHWTLDLAFPLAYGFLATTCWAFGLRLLAGRERQPRFGLLWIPLCAVAFDLLENASVSILLASTPGSKLALLASTMASLCTSLKWLFVLPAFAGVVLLPLIGLLYDRRRAAS